MKIGAALLIHGWGKDMSLSRDGVVLVASFKARIAYNPPRMGMVDPLDGSVEQFNAVIIACVEDFGGVEPQKFDLITIGTKIYTVQRCHASGADEDEVLRIIVRGGQV